MIAPSKNAGKSSIQFEEISINEQLLLKIKDLVQNKKRFYIYDVQSIRNTIDLFLSIPYGNLSINIATMANANPQFLKIVKEQKANVFVNSLNHLKQCEEAGFKEKEIVFTSSASSAETMEILHQKNVIVNLDSLGQINKWKKVTRNAPFGIRCNIGDSINPRNTRGGFFIGKESRLGLSLEEISQLEGNDKVIGLHLYAGTDIMDLIYFLDCYKEIIKLAKLFPNIQYLDFGGGFGIGNTIKNFDIKNYGQQVTKIMSEYSSALSREIKLILEPGRIIGGEFGYFVCQINDIKIRGNKQLLGVNASSTQFPRPLFYPEDSLHPVMVLGKDNEKNLKTTSIYGSSTYSRDFLARDIGLTQNVEEGDFLVFGNCGSYSASGHTSFLGFSPIEEIYYEV